MTPPSTQTTVETPVRGTAVARERGWRRRAATPGASVCLHALLNVRPLPGDVVAIENGALNWLGWYVAAFVQFAIGRRAAKNFDLGDQRRRLPGSMAVTRSTMAGFGIIQTSRASDRSLGRLTHFGVT